MKKLALIVIFSAFGIFAQMIDIKSVDELEVALSQPDKLLLFDMYADWCRPCRLLHPILEELSKEIKEVAFYRINIDQNREIAAAFRVRNIPLVLFFKNKEFLGGSAGLHPREYYVEVIEQFKAQK
jgi:thioredoxin 1